MDAGDPARRGRHRVHGRRAVAAGVGARRVRHRPAAGRPARRRRRRCRERRRVADARLHRRAALGAHPRPRRDRARCPAGVAGARRAARGHPRRVLDRARRRRRSGGDHDRRSRPPSPSTTMPGSTSAWRRWPGDVPAGRPPPSVPGIVFVQLDGLSKVVLERALRSGDAPTIHRWLRDGTHRLVGWETGWSSQTGVSQCGILHGSVVDMPAFRWVDKQTGKVVVSNRPESAAAIERAHSDGHGLLAHHGSSYGNLFSGDAERAVLTMSGIAKRKEGRLGRRLRRLLLTPAAGGADDDRGRRRGRARAAGGRAAAPARRRATRAPRLDRTPRCGRSRPSSAGTCAVQGVVNDIAEGRAAIYVDLLGYDEVAHHSGPERVDTLAVLRDLDRQLARIARSFRWAPRPYHLVVLSDHGQTQGATFRQRSGETLAEVVARLTRRCRLRRRRCRAGAHRVERLAPSRPRRRRSAGADERGRNPDRARLGQPGADLVPRRAAPPDPRGDRRAPPWVDRRARRPSRDRLRAGPVGGLAGRWCSVASGIRNLTTGDVTGDDPLGPFGPHAVEQVAEVDGYRTVADLMVNGRYDPELDEVAAFEEQVGSHGGLGGPQTRPFLLHPAELSAPAGTDRHVAGAAPGAQVVARGGRATSRPAVARGAIHHRSAASVTDSPTVATGRQ